MHEQVVQWAKQYPAGAPFVVDEYAQVEKSRSTAGEVYLIIIKPPTGKGNISIFLPSGIIMINGSSKKGVLQSLVAAANECTEPTSQ